MVDNKRISVGDFIFNKNEVNTGIVLSNTFYKQLNDYIIEIITDDNHYVYFLERMLI